MRPRTQSPARTIGPLAASLLLFSAPSALAVNPNFQAFFFDVCTSATGALAARCSETANGEGDLSGDSESSLNPSQVLNANAAGLAAARARSKQAQERADRLDSAVEQVFAIGGASLLAHLRVSGEQVDRRVDVDTERGYDQDGRSLELGVDYRVSATTVLGVIANYDDNRLRFDAEAPGVNFSPARRAGQIESKLNGVTAFALFQVSDRAYVDAAIGYAAGDNTFTRNSVFQESGRTVPQTTVVTRATQQQTQRWASLNLGYDLLQSDWNVTTFGALQWMDTRSKRFTERDLTGSGLNMRFGSVDDESLIGLVGLSTQRVIGMASGVMLLQARVEYQHQFSDSATSANARFALDQGNNTYRMKGTARDRNYFSGSAGMGWVFPGGWMPFVDVNGLAGYANRTSWRATAGLRKEL
jgi:uncharacterized protein YhjY with autotransporter beta-barrel domain